MAGIDNNTLLYLRGDSFKDLSLNPKSIVNHGATLDTNSNVIDLNNGGISTPYTSDFNLQEFTYEGWFKVNNGSTFLFCIGGQSGYYFGDVEVNVNDNGELLVSFSNLNNSQGTQSKNPSFKSDNMNTPNVWMYLAMVYKNKSMNIFINGKKALIYENITLNYRGSSYTVSIGYRLSETVAKCKGYCKNIRISNIARYIEDFTPPTQSFNSIIINKTKQTDTNIEFSVTKLGQEVINKVEVLQDNVVSETYTDNYGKLSYTVDKELCVIGNNDITIRVTYDDNYTEEKVITYKQVAPPLPQETPLLDTVERVKLLTELKQTEKDTLSSILTSKNVEVSEEDKMSDLIGKVDLLGSAPPPPLYLYKEGDECVDVTGGWNFDRTTNSSTGTIQVEKRNDSIYIKVVANSSTGHGVGCKTANLINFTDYKTIHFDCDIGHSDEYDRNYIIIMSSSNAELVKYTLKKSTDLPRQVISLDISNIANGYIKLSASTVWNGKWGEFILYNCWLES